MTNDDTVAELLLQALETELGGVQVYAGALRCVRNDDLRAEWEHYRAETVHHVELAEDLLRTFGIDPTTETIGRGVARSIGSGLVAAMETSRAKDAPGASEVVAAECVTLAETKAHLNWELVGELAGRTAGAQGKALKAAFEAVEVQEEEHLYHSAGWARELWIESLGLPSVIPPPEDQKGVKSAIGAARVKYARSSMV